MDIEEIKQLYDDVMTIGCCTRCFLRYLWHLDFRDFADPDVNLVALGLVSNEQNPPVKKHKSNPCVVCLDLLNDAALSQTQKHWKLSLIKKNYDHKQYTLSATIPGCCLIRDHRVQMYLREKFASYQRVKVVKLMTAWRLAIERQMNKVLDKEYNQKAHLEISYFYQYLADAEESNVIMSLTNKPNSRRALNELLATIDDEIFKKHVRFPPTLPMANVELVNMTYSSKTLCLMGNYCKYARKLRQKKIFAGEGTEREKPFGFSVQTIIENKIKKVFRFANEMDFTCSNPEDLSARVLGKGRLFKIEISNPPFETITQEKLKQIEEEIAKTKIVSINNLAVVQRNATFSALESQRLGYVSYKLLCLIPNCKDNRWYIEKLNLYKQITVTQRTVIRVLWSSDVRTRIRKVSSIKAEAVPNKPNLLVIELCSEGGLCIDEFVYGEFGRTKPSLKSLLQCDIHLLAMDIVDFGTC